MLNFDQSGFASFILLSYREREHLYTERLQNDLSKTPRTFVAASIYQGVELKNHCHLPNGGFHNAGFYSVYGRYKQGNFLVSVGGRNYRRIGDVSFGDLGVFAVDGGGDGSDLALI